MSDARTRFAASAAGALVAETSTLPTDVAKTRLQVQSTAGGSGPRYAGFVDCLRQTAAEEGPLALWKGLVPALIRQVCYTSMSLVIYEPIRDLYRNALQGSAEDAPSYSVRLAAGGTAGACAITVFNPTEVLKTQMQASSGGPVRMGDVVARVWQREGLLGFWAGVRPNVARTFLVNAAELGTYDEAKTQLRPLLGDGVLAHVGASGCAGLTSACVSTPADVVKTRLMNAAGGEQQYRGMLHAGYRIFLDEGPTALYKGFLPICTRKLIWCGVFFVSYEKLLAALK